MEKKKILMLNYEFPPLGGGGSYVSYEIAKNLVDRGHRVDVVTMGFGDLPKFEVVDGINVHRVKCLRKKKEVSQPLEQLTFILSARFFFKKRLKRISYDINHTHFIIPTGAVALWLKKKYKIEYVVTSHGSDVLGYNYRFRTIYPFIAKIWKKIVKEAKAVTSPSQFLLDRIEEIVPYSNLTVIPNGIESGKFKPMKKENYILVVTRLFKNKGVQQVIDGLAGVDLKGWKVYIVGEGPYRDILERKCVENGLQNDVIFLGWVDNKSDRLRKLYGKAKIFVSASWFESFGLTVLEALQAECYVLVSDNPGYKELNLGEQHYFKNKNHKDFREKLEKTLRKKKIEGKPFDRKYEWDNIIKKYEKVLA